jgi:hypothetical protein
MSYTLTITTPAERDLVVEVIRAAAAQRIRVATKAAGLVKADKAAKRDVRASSVRVAMVLAEADTLTELADELAAMADGIPVLITGPTAAEQVVAAVQSGMVTIPFPEPPDDGTSEEAQRIAALAGLEPAGPDDEDPLTNALPEDSIDALAEIDLGANS